MAIIPFKDTESNRGKSKPLLGGEQGIRLSLAGAQDKLAVHVQDGQIALAKYGTPTTHILKPFIQGLNHTVENEYFCMRLAKELGLNVPEVSIGLAGKISYLLVLRYDRKEVNGNIIRLHQEDFCQALSVLPELKYEEEGGPSIAKCEKSYKVIALNQPLTDYRFRKW